MYESVNASKSAIAEAVIGPSITVRELAFYGELKHVHDCGRDNVLDRSCTRSWTGVRTNP